MSTSQNSGVAIGLFILAVTTALVSWALALWGVPTGALAISVGVTFSFAVVPTRRPRAGEAIALVVVISAAAVTAAWNASWSFG